MDNNIVNNNVNNKKGKGCFIKTLIIGCLLTLLMCCTFSLILIINPSIIINFINSIDNSRDLNLTRLTDEQEYKEIGRDFNDRILTIYENDTINLNISEKELLYLLLSNNNYDSIDDIAVDIENNSLIVEGSASLIIERLLTIPSLEDKNINIDLNSFNNIYITIEFISDNEGFLILKEVRFNNRIINSLFKSIVSDDFINNFNETLRKGFFKDDGSGERIIEVYFYKDYSNIIFENNIVY